MPDEKLPLNINAVVNVSKAINEFPDDIPYSVQDAYLAVARDTIFKEVRRLYGKDVKLSDLFITYRKKQTNETINQLRPTVTNRKLIVAELDEKEPIVIRMKLHSFGYDLSSEVNTITAEDVESVDIVSMDVPFFKYLQYCDESAKSRIVPYLATLLKTYIPLAHVFWFDYIDNALDTASVVSPDAIIFYKKPRVGAIFQGRYSSQFRRLSEIDHTTYNYNVAMNSFLNHFLFTGVQVNIICSIVGSDCHIRTHLMQ